MELLVAPKGQNLNSPGRQPRVMVIHKSPESPEGATDPTRDILPPLRGFGKFLFSSYLGLAPQAIQISPLRCVSFKTPDAGRPC